MRLNRLAYPLIVTSLVLLSVFPMSASNSAELPCKEINLVENQNGQDQICVQLSTGLFWQARNSNIEDIQLLDYVPIYDGFEIQIDNFDRFLRYEVISTSGQVSLDSYGLITVTGDLEPKGILEIRAYRGLLHKVSRYSGEAFELQIIDSPRFSAFVEYDGFAEIEILNYEMEYYYEAETTMGDVSIDNYGIITLSNYDDPIDADVKITIKSEGFKTKFAFTRFGELKELPVPVLSAPTPTSISSFEFDIKNYDSSFQYRATPNVGKVTISGTGHVTVYALSPGQSASVEVLTYSQDIQSSVAVVLGRSLITFQKVNEKELSVVLSNPSKNVGKGYVLYAQLTQRPISGVQDFYIASMAANKLKPTSGLRGKNSLLLFTDLKQERLIVGDFVQIFAVLRSTSQVKISGKLMTVPSFEVVRSLRY